MKADKKFAILFMLLALMLGNSSSADPGHRDRGERPDVAIKVMNDTDMELYIVIGGYNQGPVWKHSSETYVVKPGSLKVEAEVGGESFSKWIEIAPGDHHGEVTFTNRDFPEEFVRRNRAR